jgi:hypothetical protein
VEIEALARRARSDSTGAYVLADVPFGMHTVRVQALGFAPNRQEVRLLRAERVQRDFILSSLASVALPPVDVRASALGPEFEERRRRGGGYFVMRSDLENSVHRRFADALGPRVPGLRLRRYGSEAAALGGRGRITMFGSNPDCFVDVYVDGALVTNTAAVGTDRRSGAWSVPSGVFNLNGVATSAVEAVEYYPGGASIPTQYNRTGAACGVLLIWTRTSAPDADDHRPVIH